MPKAKTRKARATADRLRTIARGGGRKRTTKRSAAAEAGAVRVGVYMDRALFRRLKVRAAETGTTISRLVSAAVEKVLK